jgi:hypothetical protein
MMLFYEGILLLPPTLCQFSPPFFWQRVFFAGLETLPPVNLFEKRVAAARVEEVKCREFTLISKLSLYRKKREVLCPMDIWERF